MAHVIVVYQMGKLCGGAHEISGIKAPLYLCGGWLEGSWGGWVGGGGGGVGHGLGGWWWSGSWGGWVFAGIVGPHDTPIMGGVRCPHVIFCQFGEKTWGYQMPPMMPPSCRHLGNHRGHQTPPCDIPMLCFGNLVKKLDNLSL